MTESDVGVAWWLQSGGGAKGKTRRRGGLRHGAGDDTAAVKRR